MNRKHLMSPGASIKTRFLEPEYQTISICGAKSNHMFLKLKTPVLAAPARAWSRIKQIESKSRNYIQWNPCLRTYCNQNFRGWIAGFNPFCRRFEIRTPGYPGILATDFYSPLTGINIPNIDFWHMYIYIYICKYHIYIYIYMSVCNIWTDVKLLFFLFILQGDHPNPCQCAVSDGPTKRPQYMRISRLITVTYLLIHWFLSTCTLLDSVPNGSLQWSISCLVWFPWWLRHGAMVPREGTLFRVNWTSEFTHFNVGIRLGKVQQSPCRLPPFCDVSPILLSWWTLGTLTVAQVKPCRTTTNLLFLPPLKLFAMQHVQEATGMSFFLQVWYSLVSGEVRQIVHLIRLNWTSTAVYCPYGLTDNVWTESPYIYCCFSLLFIN